MAESTKCNVEIVKCEDLCTLCSEVNNLIFDGLKIIADTFDMLTTIGKR